MNIVDIIIIMTLICFGSIGAHRGVFKQLVTTVGFIITVILAFLFKNPLAEFLSLNLPFFKFGGIVANASSFNILLYHIVAFILIFIILEVILNILIRITGIIEKVLKITIILGIPSKILGFVAGLIEGFVILFIVLFFLNQPAFNIKIVNESKITPSLLSSTPLLSNVSSSMVKTINDINELIEAYKEDDMDSNTLNLKSIDVMLEHKFISKDYVRKLVDKGKIKVVGIDSVINKY